MLLIMGALINMEIRVDYIVINDASVDIYVLASRKKHQCAMGRWLGYQHCSDHDHLLRWWQTVAPRGRVITTLQCIMSTVFSSFIHLKLPISINIPVTIPQIDYIYKTALSQNLITYLATYLLTW